MAISEVYADAATIGSTEYSIPNDSTSLASITDDGVYQILLDLNTLAVGDQFELKIKEKVRSSDTQRVAYCMVFSHAQSEPVFITPALTLMHGWDITLAKLAGTDRSIAWSVRKVA